MHAKQSLPLLMIALLSGCQSTAKSTYEPSQSYLAVNSKSVSSANATDKNAAQVDSQKHDPSGTSAETRSTGSFKTLAPLNYQSKLAEQEGDISSQFSDTDMVQLSSDALPLSQLVHYSLGEVLGVSYILGEGIKTDEQTVTLNVQQKVSKRRLFSLLEELLIERGYVIRFNDGIFYINKETAESSSSAAFGYGKNSASVPNSSQIITQYVPFDFAISNQKAVAVQGVAGVSTFPDYDQNTLILKGKRSEILKALDFINFIDSPELKERKVALYTSTYVPVDDLTQKLPELLANEGIKVDLTNGQRSTLAMVTLDRISAVVLFAKDQSVLNRASFWLKQLDQPTKGNVAQYFTFQPQFARATDIVASLKPLIGDSSSSLSQSPAPQTANQPQSAQSQGAETGSSTIGKPNVSAVNGDGLRIVVDERTNAVIVYATGEAYRNILPLIKRMDVMPKQVLLEVMIAEVTLTDEFSMGVEFALTSGDFSMGTKGAFGVEKMGGLGMGLKGVSGEVLANFMQSNSLVNVLSRPTLVVRDGVTASMNVGTDLPIIGETTADPNGERQTTSINYRKTGVELTVTPTINAQGVVLMEIDQKISNQVDSGSTSTVGNSPAIFERGIKTEVVADSGETIILGGLMSENTSTVDSGVPGLKDIPFIGKLFSATVDKVNKTELVIMVTPKVIESSQEWDAIKASFDQANSYIKLPSAK
ncbi:secretin N-terminal domain-containing protein [Shewanella morhuae]|uniref:Pullulanase secretion envelope pulD n=1 Tax=Shewanella morhuae TaxID=365591 RepID=A0A380A6M3_9GAMM|nr:secretin N-terminal domain-containing protein [Shewanella morhuae]SUI75392.1 Pullulanase secretion envelope pulD [Shewanella morhuae]